MPHCESVGRTFQPPSSAGFTRVEVPGWPKFNEFPVTAPHVSPPGTVCAAMFGMSQSTT